MKLFYISIVILFFSSCNDASLKSGRIKASKVWNYSVEEHEGRFFLGKKVNSYGMDDDRNILRYYDEYGNLLSEKESYSSGDLSKEIVYEYDSLNRLIKKIESDYYGKGSILTEIFQYNTKDSLIEFITRLDDGEMKIIIEYNDLNKRSKEVNTFSKNDNKGEKRYKYDERGNIINESDYGNNELYKLITRKYDDSNNLIEEHYIQKNEEGDTIFNYTHIITEYNSNNEFIRAKYFYENDSLYTDVTRVFNDDKLVSESQKPIGAKRWNSSYTKYDTLGNMMEYKLFSEKGEIKRWSYKYEYDNYKNWLRKTTYKNGIPIYVAIKKIIYY